MANPNPLPTAVLKARGSWRAGARKKEPQYHVSVPKPPSWVPKEGRTFFRRLARKMAEAGVMTSADSIALGLLTNTFLTYRAAQEILNVEGITLTGTNKLGEPYTIPHPCIGISNNAWDRVLKMCMQFGLTPSSRTMIQVGTGIGQETSKENDDSRFFSTGS